MTDVQRKSDGADIEAAGGRLRLDPFALPVRFEAPLPAPRGGAVPAQIYLDRAQAVMKRRIGGVPAMLAFPIRAYRGVAVRMTADAEGRVRTVIELMHRDPALSLPLVVADDLGDGEDVAADWQAWGRALGLPLLIVDTDGAVREPVARLGGLDIGAQKPRRLHSHFAARRPRFLKRRKVGRAGPQPVLCGREIIARD
ncbi:DUF6101 family protein [Prosthecomicrobium pneumaticum]|uniref:Uncharacterized protein n=1 Tax=Prosthecomicrobium pneumaticum TaxID=81895 RepID=A0A7W9CV08_9HYPH|nr:DUF6101 family protein [Prosthecomicrobium pneumaticum]MBB5752101.1 hypothetical protein [Prosthecomicrobium pneumaticum]